MKYLLKVKQHGRPDQIILGRDVPVNPYDVLVLERYFERVLGLRAHVEEVPVAEVPVAEAVNHE